MKKFLSPQKLKEVIDNATAFSKELQDLFVRYKICTSKTHLSISPGVQTEFNICDISVVHTNNGDGLYIMNLHSESPENSGDDNNSMH